VVAGIVREDLQGDDGLGEVVQLADVLVARQGALVYRIQFVTVVAAGTPPGKFKTLRISRDGV
jgi:hypothetical protein